MNFSFRVFSGLCVFASFVPMTWGQQLPEPPSRSTALGTSELPVQSSIWKAVELSRTLNPIQLRGARGLGFVGLSPDGYVHVEIVGPAGSAALPPSTWTPFGARLGNTWRNYTDLWLPLDRVEACARALPSGFTIMRASGGELDDVAGEGPAAIGSDTYRDGGADGSGRRIAVIDVGFDGLTEARANGDAPATGATTQLNYTSDAFEDPGTHGTGCVEAAFDHCPGATWRLYRTNSTADVGTAVDDCIANGVDVITMSLSKYNLGWADDSGGACDAADLAADNGILFFTSAGNRAKQHWQGEYDAGDGSADWHDFANNGDETIDIDVNGGDSINFYLAWDTSGGTHNLDLYLYDSTMTLIDSSTSGGETFEDISYDNPSATDATTIHVAVRRVSSSGTEFELFGHGDGTWEHIVNAGSTTSPSNTTNQSVISVAAVDWSAFGDASPSTQSYSSQGPTNSGMTVPDLAGPTNTSGFTYNSFGGTSCATPNTAGAACAFWSQRQGYSNHAIRWLMYQHGVLLEDWGSGGNDNSFGYGGANLWPYAWGTRWLARNWGNTGDASTGPAYTMQGAYDAVSSGGRILIFPGGEYPEVPSPMTKRVDIETVENAAVIGGL